MMSHTPFYNCGTHRLLLPEQTLANITPFLIECGITRCTEITGLDVDLGVPTYCAIRPQGLVLQTSAGKGLTHIAAKVSALMEALELYHAENPEPQRLRRTSLKTIARKDFQVIRPEDLPAYNNTFFSEDYIIDWIEGENLLTQKPIWAPASAIYFCEPSLYRNSTNGLASGNHLIEATLHALYELIERDAISQLDVNGHLAIKANCRVIDTSTIDDIILQEILCKIEKAQSKLVLLWVSSSIPVHTFWAVLLNKTPFGVLSTFNVGYGTHLDMGVAAARAVTEAVQSRLTMIHGTREDITAKPVYKASFTEFSPAYKYFDELKGNVAWQAIKTQVSYKNIDLEKSYQYLLTKLLWAGHDKIFRFNLTNTNFNIPVVKVIVPSLLCKRKLF